jgi:hypothetical protein
VIVSVNGLQPRWEDMKKGENEMTCVTKLVLFTENPGTRRNETAIYVEDISTFFHWWISAPPLEMRLEVPGEFENVTEKAKTETEQPEKKLLEVMME